MSGRRGGWVDPHAGMPGRRLFIALPLPEAAATAVTAVVEDVRGQPLPDGMHDVRWVRLDGLHLTLRFIGPTLDERIAALEAVLARVAAATAPIPATLSGTGTFPPTGRPRTLWIGVRESTPRIGELAGALGDALAEEGWPRDDRPVRPHLTLARSDGMAAGPLVAGRLAAAVGDTAIPCPLDRLGLFESVTGGGPARYVPVALATLVGQR